jgi:protein transport protein SEC23
MTSFEDVEDLNGLRLSWNTLPNSRIEATRLVVPIGAIYTPLKERPGVQAFPYEPTGCRSCRAILNPFCQLDFRGRLWNCAFCLARNPLPPHYADISPAQLPAELLQDFTTMEYILNRPLAPPPVFLFVVDTCLEESDLKALKDALVVSLSLLPQNALIGLITFGTNVTSPFFLSILLCYLWKV